MINDNNNNNNYYYYYLCTSLNVVFNVLTTRATRAAVSGEVDATT